MAQGDEEWIQVLRSTLFTVIDEIFRANDKNTSTGRREPILLKKLDQGDCT